jgi:hypothetical protein
MSINEHQEAAQFIIDCYLSAFDEDEQEILQNPGDFEFDTFMAWAEGACEDWDIEWSPELIEALSEAGKGFKR